LALNPTSAGRLMTAVLSISRKADTGFTNGIWPMRLNQVSQVAAPKSSAARREP
jgi:hypothetical protein